MILEDKICHLAHLYGIELHTSIDNKIYLLQSIGILPQEFDINDKNNVFNNVKKLDEIIKERVDSEFVNIVHQVSVLRKNRVKELIISLPDNVKDIKWTLTEEEGNVYNGKDAVSSLEKVKNKDGEDCTREIDGTVYRKYKFKFPFDVELGYHEVQFSYINPKNGHLVVDNSRVISAPKKCYDRLGVNEGKKTWGVPVQLYEQVSENNLGIGNFSDLAQIGNTLGRNGAGIMGVNPLHAMRDDYPENASPYSPDSRMFYNYIYLDVTAVKDFSENQDIMSYYHSPEFQEKINKNRRKGYVDYATTQELLDDILWKCYDKFSSDKKSEDYKRFCVYCDDKGEDLEKYATFRALCKVMSQQNPAPVNWHQWPKAYKNPNSPEVIKFEAENRRLINFYKYTQYQCDKQLERVQETCLSSGMKIGLYTDQSVGGSCFGFEAWYQPDLYMKASAGAPPDILSQNGQIWNVVGFNPIKLREKGYEPYSKIMRASMKYAGCTRIDHVLQLQRLYMVPHGHQAVDGAFIYYNFDELMAIVALESHRNKTMVIGEDLGMLPEGFRPKLEDFGILSYRVLPFEREWGFKSGQGTNAMKHPNEYPVASVCATSTHDTPPLDCQWNVQDVYLKRKLGFISEAQANDKFEQYATQREALNYALTEKGCWQRVGGVPCNAPRQQAATIPDKYEQAVVDYLGQSNSAIMLLPFSDIFGTKEMGNIPGITELAISEKETMLDIHMNKAYPNWRKKMHIPVEHIDKVPAFKEIAKIANGYRSDGNDGKGRYYQFNRMGEEKAPVIDFERYYGLYERIKGQQKFEQENIIRSRYSPKFSNHLEKLTGKAKNYYNNQRLSYKEYIINQKILGGR